MYMARFGALACRPPVHAGGRGTELVTLVNNVASG